MYREGVDEDLHSALGAGPSTGSIQVTLFVPSVDRAGRSIDQPRFLEEALRTFGTLFRGATAFPPGRGVWRDDDAGGELVFDDAQMVTSYVDPAILSKPQTMTTLRRYLHSLGRDANQGEVGVVIDGKYYGITNYDREEGHDD